MAAELPIADVVIAIVLIVSAVFGLLRGFVKEVAALAIWTTAGIAGLSFGKPLGQAMGLDIGERLQTAAGYAAVFIGVLIVGAFAQRMLRSLVMTTGLSGTDRTLGLLFGGARGVLIVTLTLIVLRPFAEERAWWTESKLIAPLMVLEEDMLRLTRLVMDLFAGARETETEAPEMPEVPKVPLDLVPDLLREAI